LSEIGRDSLDAFTILTKPYPYPPPSLDYEILTDKRVKTLLLAYQSENAFEYGRGRRPGGMRKFVTKLYVTVENLKQELFI
jgi:hypothetical protein